MKQNQTKFNLGPYLQFEVHYPWHCAVHQRNYYKTRQQYTSVVSRIAFALLPIETVKMRSLIILGLFSLNSFSQAAPQSGTSVFKIKEMIGIN